MDVRSVSCLWGRLLEVWTEAIQETALDQSPIDEQLEKAYEETMVRCLEIIDPSGYAAESAATGFPSESWIPLWKELEASGFTFDDFVLRIYLLHRKIVFV
ncbi:MAG: hypothetical protein WEC84_03355 [Candidatus Andersenbacteria bacterium]